MVSDMCILTLLGFLTEADRELRDFVENIDIHYTNNKRDTLLKQGRAIIMSEDFKTIQVKDLDKDGKHEEKLVMTSEYGNDFLQ